ncbi:cold-regulated protein 27 isoform X2 [Pyrus x bretschneideri]|uniref:cold-regulated protein 27 isoform X2 n=1 Tax=Pyrus x bretschneideri TaxID=225117 RepID=UPI0005119D71|nr:cold-regulated protein 27 isoform X2 [Pyrus x bretschneideri]
MDNFIGGELKVSMQTGERLGGDVAPAEDPPSDGLGIAAPTETMSTEWTDEKHSMYLKSMEASFVNQLYNSMDSRGRNSQKGNSSHPKLSRQKQPQFNSRAPSGRFKVLRGGCWQKVNFVRAEAEARADEDLLANPWFLHFRSAGKPKEFESPIVQELDTSLCEEVDSSRKKEMTGAPATCSTQFHASHSQLRHQDMIGSNTGALSYTLRSRIRILSMKISKKRQLVHVTVVPLRKPAGT